MADSVMGKRREHPQDAKAHAELIRRRKARNQQTFRDRNREREAALMTNPEVTKQRREELAQLQAARREASRLRSKRYRARKAERERGKDATCAEPEQGEVLPFCC